MTTLLDRLQHDLAAAIKAGNDTEKSTLRMAIAAVKNAAVAGDEAVTLTDDQVVTVLQAEAKKRSEAADIYKDAGRAEAEASEHGPGGRFGDFPSGKAIKAPQQKEADGGVRIGPKGVCIGIGVKEHEHGGEKTPGWPGPLANNKEQGQQ